MKVIVKIGYQEILLPDENGVQTILKALGKGILVDDLLYKGEVKIENKPLEIGFKTVPAGTKFTNPQGDEIIPAPKPKTIKVLSAPKPLQLTG